MHAKPRLAFRIAEWVLSVLVAVLLVAIIAWFSVPKFLGLEPAVILTGSMEPALPVGSVAFVKPAKAADIKVGDIMTFRHPDHPEQRISHRVVAITPTDSGLLFETKGDANEQPDDFFVLQQNVEGKIVWDVPYIGHLTQKVRGPQGFLIIIIVPALLLGASEVRSMAREIGAHRRKRAAAQGESTNAGAPS